MILTLCVAFADLRSLQHVPASDKVPQGEVELSELLALVHQSSHAYAAHQKVQEGAVVGGQGKIVKKKNLLLMLSLAHFPLPQK